MNREIKFRGKTIEDSKWIYGDLTTNLSWFPASINDIESDCLTKIDPDTFGQYTGLVDKNGKSIYEGDRILYSNSLERGEGLITFDRGFNIEWDLRTVVTNKPSLISPLFYFGCVDEIEVIGNIHENPELLQ